MPDTRPTTPRPFSNLMSEPAAITLLASLPLSAPGLTAEQLAAALHDDGHSFSARQVRDLMERCRLYGAEIISDRRQPRTNGACHARYYWSPTIQQLREVEASDAALIAG